MPRKDFYHYNGLSPIQKEVLKVALEQNKTLTAETVIEMLDSMEYVQRDVSDLYQRAMNEVLEEKDFMAVNDKVDEILNFKRKI